MNGLEAWQEDFILSMIPRTFAPREALIRDAPRKPHAFLDEPAILRVPIEVKI
jgi:hypothetical protein